MNPNPLDWLREADQHTRDYRKMVVGWQNSVIALNSAVRAFTNEYLKTQEEKDRDTHHVMREIAIKKLVISALFELKPQIDKWYRRLEVDGLLSDRTREKKLEVKRVIAQVAKFEDIRNAAFHFGDVNEDTSQLLQLYEDIQKIDLAFLNHLLEDLMTVGFMLRDDAAKKA
jgi:hypothetical protein